MLIFSKEKKGYLFFPWQKHITNEELWYSPPLTGIEYINKHAFSPSQLNSTNMPVDSAGNLI